MKEPTFLSNVENLEGNKANHLLSMQQTYTGESPFSFRFQKPCHITEGISLFLIYDLAIISRRKKQTSF